MPSVIVDLSLREIATHIREGVLDSSKVLTHYLERLKTVNESTNCVTQFNDEGLLFDQATEFDKHRKRLGHDFGLCGVPLTVKDAMKLKGFICAKGSMGLKEFRAEEDATIVQRVKKSGALILAQTNVPELLLAFDTDNDVYGRTSNPHNLSHSAGGSSGGEAVAIAAGGSPAGLASDAAGSVRVPAHFCGVSALKVTQGRLPTSGSVPRDGPGVSSRFSSFGLMSRWVDDLQYLLEITAGPDGIDPYCPPVPVKSYRDVNIQSLNIAYHCEGINGPAQGCIVNAIADVVLALRDEGITCDEYLPSNFHDAYPLLFETLLLGGDEGKSWGDIQKLLNIDSPSRLFQEFCQHAKNISFSLSEFRHRLAKVDQYCFTLLNDFLAYDIILCPVSATTAPLHGKVMQDPRNFSFTMPFSLNGWPVVVVPLGLDKNKMPFGIQVVAKSWCEDKALAVAKYIEETFGGWKNCCKNII
jgi:amidase